MGFIGGDHKKGKGDGRNWPPGTGAVGEWKKRQRERNREGKRAGWDVVRTLLKENIVNMPRCFC